MKEVYFYTRPRCPLCEEAEAVLKLVREDASFQLYERNIDDKDEWMEKYGLMIPVVEIDGKVVQYGHIDYPTIKLAVDA
ncbi:glutaredoxin family protein [Bacillus thermotolerans]|uniref:Glutaredoxin family protein n=1 Tax=Bacillus thermotolerans TaxID=1221996 RepID=A0A0F5I7T1_BACTR|nr:glutaredoxin family protein [Bacillus thermotolerans]KKB38653.1 glutaredoxin family protein [Bacillus thermotolerans]KKB40306.1 glutaredoxin family protein [Bacillus thermotolerans]KKB41566.1 glutaredoxin family protein [Bacillus thermotolerans]